MTPLDRQPGCLPTVRFVLATLLALAVTLAVGWAVLR